MSIHDDLYDLMHTQRHLYNMMPAYDTDFTRIPKGTLVGYCQKCKDPIYVNDDYIEDLRGDEVILHEHVHCHG